MPQPDGVHTIPVPRGWSIEQSWEHIRRGVLLTDPEPNWAVILVKAGRLDLVLSDERQEEPNGGR